MDAADDTDEEDYCCADEDDIGRDGDLEDKGDRTVQSLSGTPTMIRRNTPSFTAEVMRNAT